MIIYKITNKANGKVYIGQTTKTLAERKQGHHLSAFSGMRKTKIYTAMRKYGWENFEFEELDTASSQDELDELEQHYIREYNAIEDGYNLSIGGGGANAMLSPQVKKHHDNVMKTEEVRSKISKSMRKYKEVNEVTVETRQRISDALYKFHYIDKKKPNYKVPQHMTEEHKQKLNEAKHKAVKCLLAGGTEHVFKSTYDGAYWWKDNGYNIGAKTLCSRIKQSCDEGIAIKGVVWSKVE